MNTLNLRDASTVRPLPSGPCPLVTFAPKSATLKLVGLAIIGRVDRVPPCDRRRGRSVWR